MDGFQLASNDLARLLAARPKEVAEALHELPDSVQTIDELLDLLDTTTHLAVGLIDGADWAGVTAQLDGGPFTAARTNPRVQSIDEVQYALDDGPCLRALRRNEIVVMSADEVLREFPQFAAAAQCSKVGSFLAAPLSAEGNAIGALNLYSASADGFDSVDEDFVALLSSAAGRALTAYVSLHSARVLATQLQQALRTRAPIEQAKGILMAVHRLGADDAFALLRSESMKRNLKLYDLAVAFVAENTS